VHLCSAPTPHSLTTSPLYDKTVNAKLMTQPRTNFLLGACLLLLTSALATQLLLLTLVLAIQLPLPESSTTATRTDHPKWKNLSNISTLLLFSQFEHSSCLSTCAGFLEENLFISKLPLKFPARFYRGPYITQGDTPTSSSEDEPSTPLTSLALRRELFEASPVSPVSQMNDPTPSISQMANPVDTSPTSDNDPNLGIASTQQPAPFPATLTSDQITQSLNSKYIPQARTFVTPRIGGTSPAGVWTGFGTGGQRKDPQSARCMHEFNTDEVKASLPWLRLKTSVTSVFATLLNCSSACQTDPTPTLLYRPLQPLKNK